MLLKDPRRRLFIIIFKYFIDKHINYDSDNVVQFIFDPVQL